jgi:hypothetical protein
MILVNEIISGVVASFIFILLIQTYLLIKNKLANYKLKKVLSVSEKCLISTSIHKMEKEKNLQRSTEVYTVSYIFNLLSKINIDVDIIPFHHISESNKPLDEFCLAGGLANERTEYLLKEYCSKFIFVTKDNYKKYIEKDKELKKYLEKDSSLFVFGYYIDKEFYPVSPDHEMSFLVKLKTNYNKTIHLIFGVSSSGTAASAYYLSENYSNIYRKFGGKGYFIILKTSKRLGGHKYVTFHKDVTSKIF